jgi:VanZ family protein
MAATIQRQAVAVKQEGVRPWLLRGARLPLPGGHGQLARFMRDFCFYWLPVLVWMAVIFGLSTSRFSMARTAGFIEPLLRRLFGRISEDRLMQTHIRIREAAHFLEYLLLSLLVFRALRAGDAEVWEARWAVVALLITVGYGLLDELHQRWEAGRTARWKHAMINAAGGLAGQVLIFASAAVFAR